MIIKETHQTQETQGYGQISSAAEATYTQYSIDFLSNGFQLKDTTAGYAMNTSGGHYIYMAFAADPDTEAPTVAKSFTTVSLYWYRYTN